MFAAPPACASPADSALALVGLDHLSRLTAGRPEVVIALIDGPVDISHRSLAGARLQLLSADAACEDARSFSCSHGTFVARLLGATTGDNGHSTSPGRRDRRAGLGSTGLCRDCTIIACSIFPEAGPEDGAPPLASPADLARALLDCLAAGANVINLSLALERCSSAQHTQLAKALDRCAAAGVIIAAAAGNHGHIGGTTITTHPWVIPVAACDAAGRPLRSTNLGRSIGGRGLMAPGEGVRVGSGSDGLIGAGTSVAAPLVAAAAALLLSLFPQSRGPAVQQALLRPTEADGGVGGVGGRGARRSVVPPLLDAVGAWRRLHTPVHAAPAVPAP